MPTDDAGVPLGLEPDLRTRGRDLIALSTMPTWWVGRSPRAITESVRDLLLRMLRAEGVYVRLREPDSGTLLVSFEGFADPEIAAILSEIARTDDATGSAAASRPGLAHSPVGLTGEHGDLVVRATRPGFPTGLDTLLLQVAANQVAVALRHTALRIRHEQAEHQLGARVAQQEAVARIGLSALTGTPLEQVLAEAVEAVRATLQVEYCELLELVPDSETFLLKAGVGWRSGRVGHARVSAGPRSMAGYTLSVAGPVIVPDLNAETRFTPPPLLIEHGVISGVTVFIHGDDRPFGVLGAHTATPRAFTSDDAHFLQAMANLLATTLHRRQIEAERERMLGELRTAVAGRDRTVGIVSHDIRSLLSTIQICATALLDPEPPTPSGVRNMAGIIQRSATWMEQIASDLLDRSSLDAGRLVLERHATPVAEILGATQALFSPIAEEQSLELVVESPAELPAIDVDSRRLVQILSNLLGNAMKFTPVQGRVRLSAESDPMGTGREAPGVRFSLSDTGPGIREDEIAHIFDWHWHAGAGHRAGVGLGLAIAKGLVEAHGSRLNVHSVSGQGSTFWFTMPAVARAQGP